MQVWNCRFLRERTITKYTDWGTSAWACLNLVASKEFILQSIWMHHINPVLAINCYKKLRIICTMGSGWLQSGDGLFRSPHTKRYVYFDDLCIIHIACRADIHNSTVCCNSNTTINHQKNMVLSHSFKSWRSCFIFIFLYSFPLFSLWSVAGYCVVWK